MSQYRDPWAKREAWRKNAVFSNKSMFRNLFPGLGIAIVAFSAYVAYDNMTQAAAAKVHGKEEHAHAA